MFFFRNSPSAFYSLTQFSILLVPLILVWFFKEFYKEKPLKNIILKVLAALGLTILGYLIFIILAGVVGFGIAMIKGPEALEYMKPK